MKLYHGTHTGSLDAILQNGIVPRLHTGEGGNWHTAPSKHEFVYFTTAYALYYALASVPEDSSHAPAIIEIETEALNERLLCPDEDFIAQVLWAGKQQGKKLQPREYNQAKSLTELTSFIHPMDYQPDWKKSLEHLGNCAYAGTVPGHAITRYAIVDRKKCRRIIYEAFGPSITVLNYQFCGAQYRNLMAFIFDGINGNDYPQDFLDERETGINVRSAREFVTV